MSLLEMSPNIQEAESPSRKRSHQDFLDQDCSHVFTELGLERSQKPDIENIPIGMCVPVAGPAGAVQ